MAGDWIKMRTDLLTSPKVVRMASALKADRFRIAGGLLSVWSLFDVHSIDGILHGYSPENLDDLAAWPGFANAMADVEWLLVEGGNLELPRFEAHNGASAKRRAQDADRKKSVRKTSASEADKMRTREEESKEKSSSNPSVSPLAEKPKPKAKPKTRLPESFLLTGEMRKWASESCPAVDVRTATEKFVDYWRGEAKTKADWPATWRNWMRREQEQAGRIGGPRPVMTQQQRVESHNDTLLAQILAEEEERKRLADGTGNLFTHEGELIDGQGN